MKLVNQAEFAALHAVSRKTVTAWKSRGWLVFQDAKVDVAASDALLKKYRRGADGAVTHRVTHEVTGNKADASAQNRDERSIHNEESAEQAAERILSATGADMNYDEARRVKENYLALLNQLEYDQKSGLVVPVADVAKVVGEDYAKVRTRLLAIPSEQAPRIHQCKTVTEVQDALLDVITQALEELTQG